MQRPKTFLADLSPEDFLRRHWQKKPLLVRGALPAYEGTLSPQELLGLSLEPEVESRVVSERGDGRWELSRGPFDEAFFQTLPESHWTLLVQDLDQHVEGFAELFELLDFLPSHRLDDIMASYAAPFGSVGPHFDQYDVFLLQVSGRRRWQISETFDRARLREDTELCILSDFVPEEEWIVEPGDLLYLPPQVAHFGVALGECVTFSLGCRAPSVAEIVGHFARRVIDESSEERRYTDPDLALPTSRSELDASTLARVSKLLRSALDFDEDAVARGYGTLVTEPKALFARDELEEKSRARVVEELKEARQFVRRKGSRWLCHPGKETSYLFADGLEFAFGVELGALVQALSEQRRFDTQTLRRWLGMTGHATSKTRNGDEASAALWRVLELGLLEPEEE